VSLVNPPEADKIGFDLALCPLWQLNFGFDLALFGFVLNGS
jgi:hypothetical protein